MLTTGSSWSSSVEKLLDCSYSVQTPRCKCQDRIQDNSSPTRSGLNTGYQVIKSTRVVNRSIAHQSRQQITEEIRTEPKTQLPIENATMEYRLAASTTNVRIHTKSGANREECEMSAGSAEPTWAWPKCHLQSTLVSIITHASNLDPRSNQHSSSIIEMSEMIKFMAHLNVQDRSESKVHWRYRNSSS
jgi:hypothetical protein